MSETKTDNTHDESQERGPDVTLNYRQAVTLWGVLDSIQPDGLRGGAAISAVGRLWQAVGKGIGAVATDKYDEPQRVAGWKPEF